MTDCVGSICVAATAGGRVLAELASRRKRVVGVDVAEDRQGDVVHVALALGTAAGLAGRLDGGQEEPDQDADDADHHQQLDQCETLAAMSTTGIHERSFHGREVEPEIDFTRAWPASTSTAGDLEACLSGRAIL